MRRLGFAAREFDNRLSPEYDLTRKQLRKHLHSDIERGRMIAAMLAPPCESWTPARDRTSVIRNKQHPWGIPREQLSDRDFEKVQVGNSTMQAAIEIVDHLHRKRLPWSLENPHASKCWNLHFSRPFKRMKRLMYVYLIFVPLGRPGERERGSLWETCTSQILEDFMINFAHPDVVSVLFRGKSISN